VGTREPPRWPPILSPERLARGSWATGPLALLYAEAAKNTGGGRSPFDDKRPSRLRGATEVDLQRSRKDHRIRRTVQDSAVRPGRCWTIRTANPYRTGLPGLGWTHRTVSNRL